MGEELTAIHEQEPELTEVKTYWLSAHQPYQGLLSPPCVLPARQAMQQASHGVS